MLKSDKILLRPLQLSDLDFLFEIENNKENWKYGTENKQYTKEELTNYIANAKQDIATAGQFRFVIDFRNTPIGFIDLFDYTTDSAGVGVIITKKYRGRGFAKEVLKLLIDYATNTLKIEKLHCNIQEDNFASIKLFTSCGFELEKEEKELKYFVKLAKN
jgi:diamine N-acetyltransferase